LTGRTWIAVVAVLSIATLAIGLRIGAGETMRAAIVIGAPLPSHGGHAAWQLRTQEDDGNMRSAAPTAFVFVARAHGVVRTIHGSTNVDGVAEIALDFPELSNGEPVELDVTDDRGAVLARGSAAWPKVIPHPTTIDHAILRPALAEGNLRMRVTVLGGALAPNQPGRVWVTTEAQGEAPRNVHVDATPDLGIEVTTPFAASHDPRCSSTGVIEITALGHLGGVALHARDDLGREGDWYGMLPIAAGAMHVALPLTTEPGTVRLTVTSASARTLAYVEVDDGVGRASATILTLTGEPPRAEAMLDLETLGRSFVVVSGEPEGAVNIVGAARALPIWVGPDAPCEAALAEVSAQAFPRFVALDGFDAKHAALAARRRRGRLIALGALALGSLLETLLLLRAAREGRERLRLLHTAIAEGTEAKAPVTRRGAFDILVVLMLSLLGFVLLFALVEWTSR
jgi:hypothetical protein